MLRMLMMPLFALVALTPATLATTSSQTSLEGCFTPETGQYQGKDSPDDCKDVWAPTVGGSYTTPHAEEFGNFPRTVIILTDGEAKAALLVDDEQGIYEVRVTGLPEVEEAMWGLVDVNDDGVDDLVWADLEGLEVQVFDGFDDAEGDLIDTPSLELTMTGSIELNAWVSDTTNADVLEVTDETGSRTYSGEGF